MYRFLLTPRWLGLHLFAVLAVPLCIWLGVWQLSRFEQRTHTGDHRAAQAAALVTHPVPLAGLMAGADAHTVTAGDAGREVTFSGRYDAKEQLLVPQRVVNGRNGYYVLTPLQLADGTHIAVIRGWTAGAAHLAAPPTGEVQLRGRLQISEDESSPQVISTGSLPQGQVGMISPSTLVNLLPYGVYDGWIALDAGSTDLVPVPTYQAAEGDGLTLEAFQNLGYTCQWFVFAGFAVFMWARLVRREAELVRDRRLGIVTA
ncbi:SURF1 family protein [Streptacidiphilus sp. PB12-B1b]|uniref:SURF1 family protein n=1 Tax=Streptacidiphilus sp. PB12-B1b TaxID=2705012 RepID=UPI0015FC3147|nr:SURF1 family protein [Streptacidiphilus sp. PB12-B1b]